MPFVRAAGYFGRRFSEWFSRLSRPWQNVIVVVVLVLFVGSPTVTAVGVTWTAHLSSCVNSNLGARQHSNLDYLRATRDYSGAQDQYLRSILAIHGRDAQLAALRRIEQRNRVWYQAISAAYANAQAHPYGRC